MIVSPQPSPASTGGDLVTTDQPVLALCFLNYGPYHLARYRWARQAAGRFAVCGLQMARQQTEYAWNVDSGAQLTTVVPDVPLDAVSTATWRERVDHVLGEIQPACCAVAGYSHASMLAVIEWCRRAGKPVVLMSDSTAWDAPRTAWREWIKGTVVGQCAAGFVAGEPHRDYLSGLGLPRERITLGYDVVDNHHFASFAQKLPSEKNARRKRLNLPQHYFLASARFIEKKNLLRLLEAYALYRRKCTDDGGANGTPWDLVIVGDGPLRDNLEQQCRAFDIADHVFLPGFRQYDELPDYYGLAEAFIHASTVEQWGLVVNEAMAASLPVLVSDRCGCASTLVKEGENGFTFDPHQTDLIADRLLQMSRLPVETRREMGQRSAAIVANFGLDRFASGLFAAAQIALNVGPSPRTPLRSLVLRTLIAAGR